MKKVFLSKIQFDQWVKDMVSSYNHRGSVFKNVRRLTLDDANGNTIIMNLKTGKTAIARYDGKTKYSPELGLAVAWAKYKHLNIPIVATKVTTRELKFLDEFYMDKYSETKYVFIGSLEYDPQSFIARDENGILVEIPYENKLISGNNNFYVYRVEDYRI